MLLVPLTLIFLRGTSNFILPPDHQTKLVIDSLQRKNSRTSRYGITLNQSNKNKALLAKTKDQNAIISIIYHS